MIRVYYNHENCIVATMNADGQPAVEGAVRLGHVISVAPDCPTIWAFGCYKKIE